MWRKPAAIVATFIIILCSSLTFAQTLGNAPMFNRAVQGQNGAQPEGALFNFINWIGNVVAPVMAGGAVFGAIVAYISGRGFSRWLFAAVGLLAVSGITRLLEFWIQQGTAGVN
jgi:hypothetical protein